MNIVLINTGTLSLPVTADNETAPSDGQLTVIIPGETYEFEDARTTVLSVGDNPSFLEEFGAALAGLLAGLVALFKRFGSEAAAQDEGPAVAIALTNNGPNALRVIVDSNTNDSTLDAGATASYEAARYVELRELGV